MPAINRYDVDITYTMKNVAATSTDEALRLVQEEINVGPGILVKTVLIERAD